MTTDLKKDEDEWLYKTLITLDKGLNTARRAELLEDGELTVASNVKFLKDQVQLDTGYATFAGVVRGVPRASYQLYKRNGSSELLLITDDTFYTLVLNEWQYASDGNDTTTDAGSAAGSYILSVVSETGFSPGDYMGVILDDGTQHQTTVDTTAAGQITMIDPVPVDRSVSIGAAVVKAVDLNGTADFQISLVTMPAYDWAVFTNGLDPVKTAQS